MHPTDPDALAEALTLVTDFEPCPSFTTDDGGEVCATCGWLDHEHAPAVPAVTVLGGWATPPARLAS